MAPPHSQDGQTALHWAALRGEMAAVRLMIEQYKVDPDIADFVRTAPPPTHTHTHTHVRTRTHPPTHTHTHTHQAVQSSCCSPETGRVVSDRSMIERRGIHCSGLCEVKSGEVA